MWNTIPSQVVAQRGAETFLVQFSLQLQAGTPSQGCCCPLCHVPPGCLPFPEGFYPALPLGVPYSPYILSANLLLLCLPKGSGGSAPSPAASFCPHRHTSYLENRNPPPSPASPQPLCPQHLQLPSPWDSSSCSAFHPCLIHSAG